MEGGIEGMRDPWIGGGWVEVVCGGQCSGEYVYEVGASCPPRRVVGGHKHKGILCPIVRGRSES